MMALSWGEIRNRAIAFAREWADARDERGEAQSFWNAFFEVFGVPRRRLATFEKHVKKAGKQAGFIDLFWPGVLIAEHKSRGRDLGRAFDQAIDYFPGMRDEELPRYVIVSDFARFRITDLETGDEREFALEHLYQHVQAFGFIAGYETRHFDESDPVNVKAVERLGHLHDAMRDGGYGGHQLEVYLVRLLFCMFAEDTGIFMPRGAFQELIEYETKPDGSDLGAHLNELFDVLATPEAARSTLRAESLLAFPYVNGGLFNENLRTAAFNAEMREALLECCRLDWGQISPAIFGSLFQGVMDPVQRRTLGAHYTSEKNIFKVIGPLFLDELKAEFKRIQHQPAKLRRFHDKLANLQFLDPACGCGNFLVVTYRELRLLELEVIKILYEREQQQLSFDAIEHYVKVNVDQFHGIEIEEWPAQIAKTAMWLMDHQMNVLVSQVFGNAFARVPLVKSANIVHGNALQIDWNDVLPASRCHYILGNPPFRGSTYQTREQKADMAALLRGVKGAGILDLVAGWFVKSVDYMHGNPRLEAGLVSTNSITQGEQVGVLWKALYERGARINFAHQTFQWKNEAKGNAGVHCVIVGFSLTERHPKQLYAYERARGEPQVLEAKRINPYLLDGPEVVATPRRLPLLDGVMPMVNGSKPTDGGHLIFDAAEAERIRAEDPIAAQYLRPFVGAEELINGTARWCFWLPEAPPRDVRASKEIVCRVEAVRTMRLASKDATTRKDADKPQEFQRIRQPETDYLAIPKVSSERRQYVPIAYLPVSTIVSDRVSVVPEATPYTFGTLCSLMHNAWMRAVCGRLESRYNYSNKIVYNNFPWPLDVSDKYRVAIEASAQGILDARAEYPDATLAELYDPLTMPVALLKAHRANDRAVDAAYAACGGPRSYASETERVSFLFELYQHLVEMKEG